MKNFGFSMAEAKLIEERYHELYKKSFEWGMEQIKTATQGYVEVAFGLRIKTPWMQRLGINLEKNIVAKEFRTVYNALGQSWGLLNDRARVEFMDRVFNANLHEEILPVAAIHDSQYYLIKPKLSTLKWLNDNLVECVQWQEDPMIAHDKVKLGGKTSVFYPTWADEIELPNNADRDTIYNIIKQRKS